MIRANSLNRIAISRVFPEHKYGSYFMSGMAFVYSPSNIYRIPFGAEDASFSFCAEKTKSELIERLTWMNIYLLNRSFQNTIGFAAHKDIQRSAINSILEINERRVFKELCNQIIDGKINTDSFQICKREDAVIAVRPLLLNHEKYYLAYAFSNQGKVSFGMGKGVKRML